MNNGVELTDEGPAKETFYSTSFHKSCFMKVLIVQYLHYVHKNCSRMSRVESQPARVLDS